MTLQSIRFIIEPCRVSKFCSRKLVGTTKKRADLHVKMKHQIIHQPERWLTEMTINHNKVKDEQKQATIEQQDTNNKSKTLTTSDNLQQHKQQLISTQPCTLFNSSKLSVSMENKTPSSRVDRSSTLMLLALFTLTFVYGSNIDLCACDSSMKLPVADSLRQASHSLSSSDSVASIERQHFGPFEKTTSEASRPMTSSVPVLQIKPTNLSHKEKLLMSLSDTIERQHFNLKPIKSLIQSRPTKFDNNIDSLMLTPQHASSSQIQSKNVNINKGINLSSGGSNNKVDQDMRQIMLMHEHAHSIRQHQNQATKASAVEQNDDYQDDKLASSWLPTPSTGASILGSKKILTNVASYLSPLLAGASQGSKLFVANLPLPIDSGTIISNTTSKSRKTSKAFSPRTNVKNHLAAPLLGLGQMFAPVILSTKTTIKNQHNKSAIVNSIGPKKTIAIKRLPPARILTKQTTTTTTTTSAPQQDLLADSSEINLDSSFGESTFAKKLPFTSDSSSQQRPTNVGSWIKNGANHLATNYFQDSFRDLLTLSQLPILLGGPVSTAPSDFEPGGKQWIANKLAAQQSKGNRTLAIDDLFRYAYLLSNGVRRKRDPLKALGPQPSNALLLASNTISHTQERRPSFFSKRSHATSQATSTTSNNHESNHVIKNSLVKYPSIKLSSLLTNRKVRPRGVMWDMATDPTLAVTMFHLIERASIALPLGFLLMPLVRMIRNPLNGINLGRIIPARASHRSVEYEELIKRLDMVDKVLSKALRSTHREAAFMTGR